jgi:hypothetical protein
MTGAERNRRYLAKLVAKGVAANPIPHLGVPHVKLEDLRRWPDKVVPWLRRGLGRETTVRLRDALSQALEVGDNDSASQAH